MGNCCSNAASTPETLQEPDYSPITIQDANSPDEEYTQEEENATITTPTRSTTHTPFLGTPDPIMRTGPGSSSPFRDEDPRLLSLLEFFRQLYTRRKDLFRKVCPVHRDAFEEIFKKMGTLQEAEKRKHDKQLGSVMLRQRSMSFGAAAAHPDKLKLERIFKVKPIDSGPPKDGGGNPTSSGGGGGGKGSSGTKPGGSSK